MNLWTIFGIIGIFLFGVIIGSCVVWTVVQRRKPQGLFIVDMRDPENDMFRIEFFESIGELVNEHTIRLKVRRDTK